jgi:DNA repair protein RadB
LNKWLHGGYETDIVTVIYGGAGSGKTNFCLLPAVSQAKKGKKVIFIDTEGGFSVERVKQIEPEEHEKVLEKIMLLKPVNFNEQKDAFKSMLKHLKEDSKDDIGLIVVDGMTILYRLDFATAREKGEREMQKINAELVEQIKTLAEIARKKEIPVLVTNQVYNWAGEDGMGNGELKMVGGDILKYWGKCHLELKNEKGRRSANIRKHRSLGDKELVFVVDNKGVRKRGWI